MILDALLDFKHQPNVDSPHTLFAIVLLGVLSVAILFVAPVLIGAMVQLLGYSDAQAGYIISAELTGMSLATLLALYLSGRSNWRSILLVVLTGMIVGNLISFFVSDFALLCGLRFLVGMAGGVSMSLCIAMIALTQNPDRTFGLWVAGQLLFGAVGLYVLPNLFPYFGYHCVYLIVAAAMVIMLLLLRFLPQHGKRLSVETVNSDFVSGSCGITKTHNRRYLLTAFGLTALFVFYVGQYGVWAYLERIGGNSHLTPLMIGKALSVATIVGILGALTAAVFGNRYGRFLPVLLGVTISIVAMLLLLGPIDHQRFWVAAAIFSFTFNFVLPYLMAAIAAVDITGRLIMLTNVASGAGLAGGPTLAALVQQHVGYDAVLLSGVGFTGLSLLLVSRLALSRGGLTDAPASVTAA